MSTEALRFQCRLPEAAAVVVAVAEAAIGTGNTLTAPGMSSGLIGVFLSVDDGVSRDKSSDGLEPAASSADEKGGCGVVIMSSKRRALRFTEINSFFSMWV